MRQRISPLKLFDFLAISLFAVFFVFVPFTKKDATNIKGDRVVNTILVPREIDAPAPAPSLSAQAIYIYDPESKTTVYEKNSNNSFFPASTTKLMTALVSLSYYDLDQVLKVENGDSAVGQTINLGKGDRLTVENLLYGLLVGSGNDAGLVLAENYPGGYSDFVAKMNENVKKLGLTQTNFTNVTGLANPDHYTTAKELTIIANEAIQNATIRKIVATEKITITDITGKKKYPLESTNKLLGLEGVKGLKTGWTPESGECLVTLVIRDGKSIVITVLNSVDRFGESEKLIDWVYKNFTWEKV